MKKFQRTIAAIAAMAMAISAMSIASFAEGESSLTGTAVEGDGTFEGTVEAVKYNMILPTEPAEGFYDFILDPQGLIEQTGADRFGSTYDEDDFVDNTYLFFKNANGSYSGASDALTAYNLSSMEVVLTVEGKVTGATDLAFTAEAPTEGLNIQLGIADTAASGAQPTQYFTVAEGATDATAKYEATLDALDAGNFAIVWDDAANEGAGAYAYGYTDEFAAEIETANGDYSQLAEAKSAGFKLVGAIANDADGDKWKDYDGAPSVEIVWSMADPNAITGSAPTAVSNTVPFSSTALSIPVSLGTEDLAATGIASVGYKLPNGTTGTTESYTFENNAINFTSAVSKNIVAGTEITITFDDAAATTVKVTITES